MAWMLVSTASHPDLQSLVSVNVEKREFVQMNVARSTQRLITIDCRSEAVVAFKADRRGALIGAFSALGESSASTLVSNSSVAAEMRRFLQFLDMNLLRSLANESK